MSIKRCMAVLILLATGLVFAHCGGKLIPPADEVTTRMNSQDERALERRRTNPSSQAASLPSGQEQESPRKPQPQR